MGVYRTRSITTLRWKHSKCGKEAGAQRATIAQRVGRERAEEKLELGEAVPRVEKGCRQKESKELLS